MCLDTSYGAVAQLGERLVCNQEATGSIPVSSTKFSLMLGVSSAGIEHWVGGASDLVHESGVSKTHTCRSG